MKKKTPLFVPILWFITTAIWIATFCAGLYYKTTPSGLMLLQGICIFTSLIAAVTNLVRYKNDRKEDK